MKLPINLAEHLAAQIDSFAGDGKTLATAIVEGACGCTRRAVSVGCSFGPALRS